MWRMVGGLWLGLAVLLVMLTMVVWWVKVPSFLSVLLLFRGRWHPFPSLILVVVG